MKEPSRGGVVFASLLAGIAGSLVTLALRSAIVAAGPQTVTSMSSVPLANSVESKIQGLETKVVQLEQRLAALKTAYEGHGHGYISPACGARMTLTNFKQTLAQEPDSFMICIQHVGQNAANANTTARPVPAP